MTVALTRLSGVVQNPLAQSGVPVCLAPNGTVATNGTVTLGTALPTTYSGGIWLRLPANAVGGGTSTAGLYWTVMSSTTVGVVTTTFADTATAFTPFVPVGAVTAVGSNAAYTQSTSDITLANITLHGGMMGVNGGVRMMTSWAANNTAGAKTASSKLVSTVVQTTGGLANNVTTAMQNTIYNRGSVSAQVNRSAGDAPYGATTAAFTYSAINTAVDTALTFIGNIAVATDCIVLEAFTVEVMPA